jgi:hypothetical protein
MLQTVYIPGHDDSSSSGTDESDSETRPREVEHEPESAFTAQNVQLHGNGDPVMNTGILSKAFHAVLQAEGSMFQLMLVAPEAVMVKLFGDGILGHSSGLILNGSETVMCRIKHIAHGITENDIYRWLMYADDIQWSLLSQVDIDTGHARLNIFEHPRKVMHYQLFYQVLPCDGETQPQFTERLQVQYN